VAEALRLGLNRKTHAPRRAGDAPLPGGDAVTVKNVSSQSGRSPACSRCSSNIANQPVACSDSS
jgi:hypothetical protein